MADIHLSLKPPIWRSAEPDWLEAQARPLNEVKDLQQKYACPVLCAGDIFDSNRKAFDGWNAPPELINFALSNLPDGMYAIPGQHDLPNHQYSEICRSAYWTLVKAEKIQDMKPNEVVNISWSKACNLIVFAFPPGYEVEPAGLEEEDLRGNEIIIAVAHQYRCIPGKEFQAASRKAYCRMNEKALIGYDVIVYGDNHKGFLTNVNKDSTIFNCGTLMRRKSDEVNYKPQVGLLLDNGLVVQHHLDTSQDKYLSTVESLKGEKQSADMTKFIADMTKFIVELDKPGKAALDFRDAMKEFLQNEKTSSQVKQIILKAMEERQSGES